MIELCNSVLTPQVFFNSDHVGSLEELTKLFCEWEKESKFGGYNTVRQRVKIEILSGESPYDKRLRTPKSKEQPDERKVDKSDQINEIALPNGTTIDACKITHILMNYLPRSKYIHKTKLFYNASSGRALIETLKKLNIVDTDGEAITVCQKLLDLRVINSLSKGQVFDAKTGHYRLQPLHDPSVMNSFCFWISHSGTGEALKNPLMTLRKLSKMMKTIIEKSIIENSMKIDRKAARKSNLFGNFEMEICKLQVIDVEKFDLRTKVAFYINLYNLMVIHAMIRLDIGTLTQKHLTTVKYNVGGYLLSIDDIEHGILRANNPKPGKKAAQFSSSDARKKLSLQGKDCRIHFALNHGGPVCLGSYQYTREAVDLELKIAAVTFCASDDRVKVDEWKKELVLPWFMKFYHEDFCKNLSKLPKVVELYLTGEKLTKLRNIINTSSSKTGIAVKFEGLDANMSKKKVKNLFEKDNLIPSSDVPSQTQEMNKFSGDTLGQIPESIAVCDQVESISIDEVTHFTFDMACESYRSADEIESYRTSDVDKYSDEIEPYQDPLIKENFIVSYSTERAVKHEKDIQTPSKPNVVKRLVSPSEKTASTGERTASTGEETSYSKSMEQVVEDKVGIESFKLSSIEYNLDEIEGVISDFESPKNTFDIELDGIATNSSTLTENTGTVSSNSNDIVSRLAHLTSLKNMGALTSEEFKAAKSVVIAEGESALFDSNSMSMPSLEIHSENMCPRSSGKEATPPSVSFKKDEASISNINCSFDDLDDIINRDNSLFSSKYEDDRSKSQSSDDDDDTLFSNIFDSEIEKIVTGMRSTI